MTRQQAGMGDGVFGSRIKWHWCMKTHMMENIMSFCRLVVHSF